MDFSSSNVFLERLGAVIHHVDQLQKCAHCHLNFKQMVGSTLCATETRQSVVLCPATKKFEQCSYNGRIMGNKFEQYCMNFTSSLYEHCTNYFFPLYEHCTNFVRTLYEHCGNYVTMCEHVIVYVLD